jgi:hypothetical protein
MKRFDEVAQELVSEWLSTVQRKTGDLTEDDIDDAVDDTFPASDPVALTTYRERVDALQSLDVVVTPASITFKVPLGVLESAAAPTDEPSVVRQEIDCTAPSGNPHTLVIEVSKPRPAAIAVDVQPEMAAITESAARA